MDLNNKYSLDIDLNHNNKEDNIIMQMQMTNMITFKRFFEQCSV
jgi:hypothetical protein